MRKVFSVQSIIDGTKGWFESTPMFVSDDTQKLETINVPVRERHALVIELLGFIDAAQDVLDVRTSN